MNHKNILLGFLLLMLTSFSMGQEVDDGVLLGGMPLNSQPADVTGRYFVVFHAPPGAAERQMVEGYGAQIIWAYSVIPAFAVYAPSSAVMDAISQDPSVRYVDQDKVVYALGDESDPEITDGANDQLTPGTAAHDILGAWFQQLDDDRLQFFIKVRDLSGANPSTGDGLPPNTRWKINFSLLQSGRTAADQYFVEMRRGETGTPTFHWGFISGTSSVTGGTADAGQILVNQGIIKITNSVGKFTGAPNQNGPLKNADLLNTPFAQVQVLGGTSTTGGLLVQVDRAPNSGGGRSFTVKALLASPKALDFGSVMLGSSKTLTTTVTNSGTDPLIISSVQSDNSAYSVTPVSASIAPSASETFSVAFLPSVTGPHLGTLFFYNNATTWPGTVTLRATSFSLTEGETRPWGIDAVKAPLVWSRTTGRTVKVAVLDTGIDSLHWELDDRFRGGYNFVAKNPYPWDGHGHGTHVSGTVAAELNGAGLMGVAHEVELYAFKVLSDAGSGSFADVYAAIDSCVKSGIHIANMSLGGRVYDPTGELVFQNAFNAGLLSIAAAGNGVNAIGTPHVNYPAAYQGVVAVGAVGRNLQRAAFSDFGPNIEIVAPGVDVRSTVPRGTGREAAVDHAGTMLEANPLAFAGLTGGAGITATAIPSARGLSAADFPPEVNGNIALIERGDITFAEKVRNAQDAGAVAVIIYNNAPGNFSGTLGTARDEVRNRDWVPAVSLSQEDGQALVAAGTPTVTVFNVESDFAKFQGTSMASPHAAGVAALVKGANLGLTNQQIRAILQETATDLGVPLYDLEYGHGLVNAEAAVAQALGEPNPEKSGSVSSLGDHVTWTGFIATGADVIGPDGCTFEGPANSCDKFILTVNAPLSGETELIQVDIKDFGRNDLDLVVRDAQGQQVTSSGLALGVTERASFPAIPGTYEIIVIGFTAVLTNYTGEVSVITPPGTAEVSPLWNIVRHGECCEGNLAAADSATYVLLPVLLQGNKINRTLDGGKTWQRIYPPLNLSVPFGIEGDLQAYGNDLVYFGTELTHGVAARSTDRGNTFTVVQIPVAFVVNDQAWSYLGPLSNLSPVQTAPYVLTGWYRIGSVALFSFDGGLTWPIQTPLPGLDGSGSAHIICETGARAPHSLGDVRIPNANFANMKSGRHGGWGTDGKFYWSEATDGNLFICKTSNFGVTWDGVKHPLASGTPGGYIVTSFAFDDKGTLYVLYANKLYVSFDQGESIQFVHTLPRWGNDNSVADNATQFFVVNGGTIHIALKEAPSGSSSNSKIWYLRGAGVDMAQPTWTEELVDTVAPVRLDFMQIAIDGNGIPTIGYTTPPNFSQGTTTATRMFSVFPPMFSVSPSALNFGDVTVGSSKRDSVTVTNAGTATLKISSVMSDNDQFSVTPASGSLEPSASQKFYVTFSPTSAGSKSGNIVFTHNVAGSPDSVTVSGDGMVITTTTLDCDDGSITQFGGWHTVTDSRATNGYYCRNVSGKKSTDAYLSFSFTGVSVDMQIARGPRGGNAEVLIDGISQGKVDFFRPHSDPSKPDNSGKKDLTFGITVSFSAAQGEHTFRLNVLNDSAGAQKPSRDIVYVDGFVVRGGSTQGTAMIRESSTETQGNMSGGETSSQSSSSSSNTLLMTGVLEVADGSDLDLNLLNPLGLLVAQSTGLNPTEVVHYVPTAAGVFNFQVANTLATASSYTLYVITTEPVITLPKTGAVASDQKPKTYALEQNYPNPFNPMTEIKYALPENAYVQLRVFNVLGQEVATLVDEIQDAGFKSVPFDASRLSSGVYFYKLTAGSFIDVKRMVIMK